MRIDPETVHGRITELLQNRKQFTVATIIEVKGSSPQAVGRKMVVHPDGSFEFTIGGGTFEAEVTRDALAALINPSPASIREYKLTQNELGMYCQGLIKVLFEIYEPRCRMLILGGGHVGQALSRVSAATSLFEIVVIDDREEYADSNKHPSDTKVFQTDRDFELNVPAVDPYTFVVIVTRCHATDKLLVKRYLKSGAAYVGLIGSAAKVRLFRKELLEEGVLLSDLEELHAPIGLPIGGKDPAEVAVSILAELIQAKNQIHEARKASGLRLKTRLP